MLFPRKSFYSSKSIGKLKKSSTSRTENFKCEHQFQKVNKKMQIFFQDQKFCDVVLISAIDGVRVESHRVILAASSNYFFAMFGGCLTESRSKEVILDQVDGGTLKMLVNFMYTASIEITTNNVENLLTAANLFQIESILDQCCSFMIKQLEASNCLGLTLYAEQHNHRTLYGYAYNMVCDYFTELHNEDEFYLLDVNQLSKFLASDDLCVSSEEDVFQSLVAWVHHEKSNREQFLYKLLSHLRFPLLQLSFIEKEVEPTCQSNACQELIRRIRLGHSEPLHLRPRNSKRKIFNISVWLTSDNTLCAESYSPILKQWMYHEWPGRPTNRSLFSGTTLDDKLIIAGGRTENFAPTNIVESLDIKTLEWTELPPMNTARHSFAMAELNGKVYAVGGRDNMGVLRSVERYDPMTRNWEDVAPMWERHVEHGVVAMKGLLYVVGGSYSFECYDPQTNFWTRKSTTLPIASPSDMAVVNDKLYAVSTKDSMVQRYDPEDDSWEEISPLGVNADSIQCCAMRDCLIVNCGNSCIKEFNTVTNEWTTLPSFSRLSGKGMLLTM